MDGMTSTNNALVTLDGYARQGRMFLYNAAQNLIQFGRVLTEAKPYVEHGKFEAWVNENFGISQRTAQNYMAVWKRFGGKEEFEGLQYSALQEMLQLPEGTEQTFTETHDVNDMTAREVKRAVAEVKAEMQAALDEERKLRKMAEENAIVPDDVIEELKQKDAEIAEFRTNLEALEAESKDVLRQRNEAYEELRSAKTQLSETEDMLNEQQAEYDRMQQELLNTKSSIAKGNAERHIEEKLSSDEFAAAVRAFMGTVAQMPYMGHQFAVMSNEQVHTYDSFLQTVEDWCKRARTAIDTIHGEVLEG